MRKPDPVTPLSRTTLLCFKMDLVQITGQLSGNFALSEASSNISLIFYWEHINSTMNQRHSIKRQEQDLIAVLKWLWRPVWGVQNLH